MFCLPTVRMGNRLENDKPVDTEQLEGTCKGDLADFRQKLVDRPGVDSKPELMPTTVGTW